MGGSKRKRHNDVLRGNVSMDVAPKTRALIYYISALVKTMYCASRLMDYCMHGHATSSHSSSSHQKGRKKNVSVTSHDMTRIVYKSLLKKEGKDIFYMPGF